MFTTVALTFVIYSINNLYSVPYENIVTFRFENHFWNFLIFLQLLIFDFCKKIGIII